MVYSVGKLLANFFAYFYFIKFHNEENRYLADNIISEVKKGGNVFWKLSQWVCARTEFQYNLEGNYLIEKMKLFYENCPAHSYEETVNILKKKVMVNLRMIDRKPIASGSIGQVYKGILKNGKKVAIKVRHPNIRENIEFLCESINFVKDNIYSYGMVKNNFINFDLDGLDKYLLDQTDFRKEYENLRKLRNMFKNTKYVYFPEPLLCGDDYLVMEYIEGQNIDDCYKISCKKKDKSHWEVMLKFWLFIRESILMRNFCHADLHKGNWKINGGKIIIYDLGIILDNKEDFKDYRILWEGFESRKPNIYASTLLKNSLDNKNKILEKELILYMEKNMDLDCPDFSGDIRLLLNFLNDKKIVLKFHLLSYLMAFNIGLANFKNFNFTDENKCYVESYLDRFSLFKEKAKKYGNKELFSSLEKDEEKFMENNKDRLKEIMTKKNEKLKEIDSILDELTDE